MAQPISDDTSKVDAAMERLKEVFNVLKRMYDIRNDPDVGRALDKFAEHPLLAKIVGIEAKAAAPEATTAAVDNKTSFSSQGN